MLNVKGWLILIPENCASHLWLADSDVITKLNESEAGVWQKLGALPFYLRNSHFKSEDLLWLGGVKSIGDRRLGKPNFIFEIHVFT